MVKYQPDPPVGIVGVGSSVPEKILTNADLEKMVETSDQWIVERTGIRTRHITDDATPTSVLATEAARRALEDAGVEAGELDVIVVATATPDTLFPSTGCLVQSNLGASNAVAFDIAAACSGFIYGMNVIAGMIRCGSCRTGLVVGAETLTKIADYEDRSTCVLFGDGAGAAVVREVEQGKGILSMKIASDGDLSQLITQPAGGSLRPASQETVDQRLHYIHMDGNKVFKSAVRRMAEAVQTSLDDAGLAVDDIDLLIPHQANIRIIEATGRKAGIPAERVYINVERYGNTSAASIPIALDEVRRAGRVKRGTTVAVVAFGSGLTWGSAVHRF